VVAACWASRRSISEMLDQTQGRKSLSAAEFSFSIAKMLDSLSYLEYRTTSGGVGISAPLILCFARGRWEIAECAANEGIRPVTRKSPIKPDWQKDGRPSQDVFALGREEPDGHKGKNDVRSH